MPLQGSGEMSFAQVYNEMTGEALSNPFIGISTAELGQLQNASGDYIPLNQYSTVKPDGTAPTVFPNEWYLYCQRCNQPAPYLTITKSAPSSSNINTQYGYTIVLTNNGNTPTSGTITVIDNLQANLQYLSIGGSGFSVVVSGQVVTATYTGAVPINGQITLYIYVKSTVEATYYNYASVTGGGEAITKTSNTTTTTVAQVYYNGSINKRLVRTFQKNNCDNYGVGSYQDIYSPFFTGTYQSTISQADADYYANINANNLCNQWLDTNGQAQANQYGTCQYGYPQMTLGKSMPANFNLNETGDITITMHVTVASTSGTVTLNDFIPYGFEFVSAISTPSPFTFSLVGRTASYSTGSSLAINYEGVFVFRVRGANIGSWNNIANVQNSSIQNSNADSNTVTSVVTGNPTFSFSSGAINNSFDNNLFPRHASPTDEAYYFETLTINNAPSTNTTIPKMEFVLPTNFSVINNISAFYDSGYFLFSQGSSANIAVFEQRNNVTVPQGQYSFYLRINLAIDYYRISTTSSNENDRPNDNLIIDSNGSSISRRLTTSINNYLNNAYQNTFYPEIIWSNNYKFFPQFVMCNGNNLSDNTGLTYSYSVNDVNNFSGQLGINELNNQFFGNFIYVVNPTRDTNPGVLNSYYPHQSSTNPPEEMFGIFIYYKIYYNGTQIRLCNNANDGIDRHETYINRTYNEPKSRPTTFRISKNGHGNYLNLNGQEILPEI